MGLTLELYTFVAVLVGLQLSLVHCGGGGVLLPLQPPPLSLRLSGISVNLNRPLQLIFSHRQSYTFMDSFVERHLTTDVHSTHVGAKVLTPSWHRSFL